MELLLWRHAEAEEGQDDLKRALTPRGERQARVVAKWIRKHWASEAQSRKLRILVSPALRCQQTVNALDLPFETVRALAPDAGVADLIAASEWPAASSSVLIVGHQPTLGRMASLIMAGQEGDWSIKKGAVWCFSRRHRGGSPQTILRACISPDLI